MVPTACCAGGQPGSRQDVRTNISVVICTYSPSRWPHLAEAVESVLAQTLPAAQVLVVADHSPELAARVRSRWADVEVVENQNARGLAGARNAGVAVCQGEIVAFLDDDAVADADWLATMARAYDDEAVIGIGGTVEPEWSRTRPGWLPDEFGWVVGCSYRGLPESPAPVRNAIGANMSFRREVFARTGSFTTGIGRLESLPFGCEETEFSIRARRVSPGGVILYDPRVRVRHHVPPERLSPRYFVARCYAEGRSKALVSRLVGPSEALASERAYTRRALPAGVRRGLRDAVEGDSAGLGRAAAIVVGLSATTLGFVRGLLSAGVGGETG